MNIQSIISTCQSAGIIFILSGNKLRIKGKEQIIAKHLDMLRKHKDSIRSYLTKPDIDELVYFYEERAGIYQFDAGKTKEEAERLAYKDALDHFQLEQHPNTQAELKTIVSKQRIQEI